MHFQKRNRATLAVALFVTACGGADCIIPPCALPLAATITVRSSTTGGAINGAFILPAGYSSPLLCDQSPASTCRLLGGAGTYQIDIGAPGFQTIHRAVEVHGTSPRCGCPVIEALQVDVSLVPAA